VISCAAGEVAVGLSGRAGLIIDKVGLRCASISGVVITGSTSDGANYGGSGGDAFNDTGSLDCPSGYALYEINGSLATYLSAPRTGTLRYRCKHLLTGALSSWLPSDSTYWGTATDRGAYGFKCGSGASQFGSYINGLVIDNAASASYVGDMLGITCR
jgi:hypothetical protein